LIFDALIFREWARHPLQMLLVVLARSAVLGGAIVSGPLVGGLGPGRVSSAALDS